MDDVGDKRDVRPVGLTNRGSYALAAILFLAAALILSFPWTSGAFTIPWDAKAQAWPQIVFLARSLASGESPFWTPNVFAGHPQIADPQSLIFSPPFLLFAWLDHSPTFREADSITFAMLAVAGLCIIALFRDLKWHAAGALVAALAFAFGGSAAWRLQHIGEVMSLCWFAITFLLLERALQRACPRYGFASGVVAGFMVLGRDQIAFLCTLVLTAYVVVHLLAAGRGILTRLRRIIFPLLAGVVGGVLVITLPLVLTLSLAENSNRPEIDLDDAVRGSLPPQAFLTAIIANIFGVDGPIKDYWGPPNLAAWGPSDLALARNMITIYFGALPVTALLAVGVAGGALLRRQVRFFAIGALLLGLYALGRYTPFFDWAYEIPGVDFYRRPADATFPLCALLAIVSGYCIHRLIEAPPGPIARMVGIGLIAASFLACVYVAVVKSHFGQDSGALAFGLLVFTASVGLLRILPALNEKAPATAMAALALLMTGDLMVSNEPNESTALPPEFYEVLSLDTPNETIALIRQKLKENAAPDRRDRVELAAIDFEWPGTGLVHNFDHDLGYNPVRLKLYTDATNALDQVAIPEQRQFSPLYKGFRSIMADMLGVRLVLSRYPLEQMDKGFKPGDLDFVGRTKDAYVWENPRALPRVLFTTSALAVDFDRMLTDGNWPEFDPRRTVLLEDIKENESEPRQPGTARILSYHNTEVVIEAESPEGGIVVLNDVFHNWWFADIDGESTDMLRANVIFRGVRVPPGKHQIRFTFRPLYGLWREWNTPD